MDEKKTDENSLFDMLCKNDKIPFHMPGHKRNCEKNSALFRLGAAYDITETDGFDNLHNAEGILKKSMETAANLWGSERSFYLVNGSSGGILSAIFACVPFGGRVICARNCHKSVYNALKIRGAKAEFVNPKYDAQTGICGEISAADIENICRKYEICGKSETVENGGKTCKSNEKSGEKSEKNGEKHCGVSLVILTSPTYEGVISDVEKICKSAHKFNVPVLVDEAHGAHLSFGNFEKSAVKCGADIVVQSLHKTLASLTQTAILHICSPRVNAESVRENLAVFQTSSPSYIFMASIDLLVCSLCENKDEIFAAWQRRLDEFYANIGNLKKLEILTEKYNLGFALDRSKIVILTHKTNISGKELMEILRRKYNIECEMCSARYVVAMTGMGDSDENLSALSNALMQIDKTLNPRSNGEISIYPTKYETVMSAFCADGKNCRETDFETSKGEVSAEYIFAYPPGIPIIIPGEKISAEILKNVEIYNSNGIELLGTKGGNGKKIHIVS